jgi:hypothetical protein
MSNSADAPFEQVKLQMQKSDHPVKPSSRFEIKQREKSCTSCNERGI